MTVPTQVGTDTAWTAVTVNSGHACGLDGGALYCWGLASLGLGSDTSSHPTPVEVGTQTDWTAVAAGTSHACAIRGGALFCWGASSYGEAGPSPGSDVPTQLGSDGDWTAIAGGDMASCGLRGGGSAQTLWCWGYGYEGVLGNASGSNEAEPTQVGTADNWASVAMYGDTACALATDGTAWCWGRYATATPSQLTADTDYTAIAPGENFTCAIRAGQLACKGNTPPGGIGDGTQIARSSLVAVGVVQTWRAVATESAHACAIDGTGAVWCWGENELGELGLGTRPERPTFAQVGSATDWASVSISAFNEFACGLQGSAAYCWGVGGPWLGNGTNLWTEVPTLVGTGFVEVKSGFDAACGRKADNSLWCWGGPTTLGFTTAAQTPQQIGSATDWTDFAVYENVCGIRGGGGALYCWGPNYYGEVGDGTTTNRATPVPVGAATGWTSVSLDQVTSCGVNTGVLYCWGYLALAPESTVPQQVGTSTDWMTIDNTNGGGYAYGLKTDHTWWEAIAPSYEEPVTAGSDFIYAGPQYAIRRDDTLWNDGTQVGSDTNWATVSWSFPSEACGTKTDGTMTCTGNGVFGELGNGDAWVLVPTPVQ